MLDGHQRPRSQRLLAMMVVVGALLFQTAKAEDW